MSLSDPVATFLLEADDLLNQIEEIALDLGQRPEDDEAINRMFRAFHTLKGSGAMFGFDAVANFTHHIETALDLVRDGALAVDQRLLALILAGRDQIKILLEEPANRAVGEECERIIAELKAISGAKPAGPQATPAAKPAADLVAPATWQIFFRPALDVGASGLDPLSLLDELRSLGPCEIVADLGDIPLLDQLNPEQCHVAWRITLTTARGANAIKDVFIFVEDESQITIEQVTVAAPIPGAVAEVAAASALTAEAFAPLAGTSARVPAGATGSRPAAPAPAARAALAPAAAAATASTASFAPPASPALPASPASTASSAESEKAARPTGPGTPPRPPSAKETTVRVPSARLDQLLNLVGELVMNQSRLAQVSARIDHADLAVPVEAIERLVAELRDTVLGIRMMPIGSTFTRFKRLVHDLSQELGKEIDLVTEGAETELDKTVLDQLADPLVHLIRNCIDHAIAPPDERVRAGKPRRGTIRLNATHAGSHVVIAIHDDGRGLDTDAIRAKAIDKGLITADSALSEKELFNLIFLPGFSTAKQITNVSGRGVGMDVVKKQIDALRGGIQIASKAGVGTTISLTLPLTLAIIDGLLVELGGDQFILPMSAVRENVELHRAERLRQNGRNVVAVRGELIPYIRLRELFHLPGEEPEIEKIVIARHEDQQVGLVVDRVLGSHQTVIQSLGRFYRQIEVCSGSTIMGDGRVALILDLAGLVRHAENPAYQAQRSAA